MTEELDAVTPEDGNSRRKFLRNAGIAGGVAWAAPTIVSASPAFADHSDAACTPVGGFSENYPQTQSDGVASVGPTANTLINAGLFSGRRRLSIEASGPSGGATVRIGTNGFDPTDYLELDAPLQVAAEVIVSWGTAIGGLQEDLSFGTRFVLDFFTENQASAEDVDVTVTVNGVSQLQMVPTDFNGELVFPFASFVGVNFAEVDNMVLTINTFGLPALDVRSEFFVACP